MRTSYTLSCQTALPLPVESWSMRTTPRQCSCLYGSCQVSVSLVSGEMLSSNKSAASSLPASAGPALSTATGPAFNFGTPAPAFGAATPAKAATPGFSFGTSTPVTGLGGVGAANTSILGGTNTLGGLGGTNPLGGLSAGSANTLGGLGGTANTLGGLGGTNTLGGLGAPATTAGGFNFGSLGGTATGAASTNFSFGGQPAASGSGIAPANLFGTSLPSQTNDPNKPAPTFVGLGGVDSGNAGISGALGSQGGIGATGTAQPAPRLNNLPQELTATVENFKTCVRQRKQLSSDIARSSIRPLHKVQTEAESLLRDTSELAVALTDSKRTANGLRSRTAAALPTAERAHRIFEMPHSIEYDSGEALAWITNVVSEGEERLKLFKRKLEAAQRQLNSSPKLVTDQELALGMRRIHESFVAVAGRLQTVHQQVEAQKSQYSSLRKNILKDSTNVFAAKLAGKSGDQSIDWSTKSPLNATSQSNSVVSDPLHALGLSQSGRNDSSSGPNPFTYLGPPGFSGLPFGFASKTQTSQNTSQVGP